LRPTWRNGREGSIGISKRLDRFLLNHMFMGDNYRSRSWTINSLISHHNPICLQVEGSKFLANFPFKFNHSWLKEAYFKEMVVSFSSKFILPFEVSATQLLVKNLKLLKSSLISWQEVKKETMKKEVSDIEERINEIFDSNPSKFFFDEDRSELRCWRIGRVRFCNMRNKLDI